MKILHYFPDNDSMIAKYVSMLVGCMGLEADNTIVSTEAVAKEKMESTTFDILHLHGCWSRSAARIYHITRKKGTRLVLSPYGQLEPWVVDERYWKEKLPKTMLFQRSLVEQAYVVVIQGRMEEECIKKLGWNPRMEIIRNPIITHSISFNELAQKIYYLYRKVLDSNTIELMNPQTRILLRCFIKAGISGDSRWVTDDMTELSDPEQWRHLLCYAHQEGISNIVKSGAHIMNYRVPDIDVYKIPYFLPQQYVMPKSIQESIGMQYASEKDRLVATFKQVRRLIQHQQLSISHLCEIDKELREHDVEEDHLCEALRDKKLYSTASRTMQLLADYTGFDEGFMPMLPLNDRTTKNIHQQIYNHLKI